MPRLGRAQPSRPLVQPFAYTLRGAGGSPYTLSAASGSFALSCQDAALKAARPVPSPSRPVARAVGRPGGGPPRPGVVRLARPRRPVRRAAGGTAHPGRVRDVRLRRVGRGPVLRPDRRGGRGVVRPGGPDGRFARRPSPAGRV